MPSNKDKDHAYLLTLPEIRAAGLSAFESIPVGTTNQNWKVETTRGLWVVRKNATGVPGVDRHFEARILQLIAPFEIAPRLIAVDPDQGYLITEYVDSPAWTAEDCANTGLQKKLLERLEPVHTIELNVPSVNVRTRVKQYLSLAPKQVVQAYKDPLYALLEQLEAHGFFAQQRLCHYDLNHTNIVGYDDIKILDWEFAGTAHPILDMAVFCLYEQIDKPQVEHDPELLFLCQRLVKLMFAVWHQIQTGK